jgi:hypothetical protein
VLELCRAAAAEAPPAAHALARWEAWQRAVQAGASKTERRFCKRAYERARDDALAVLLMRAQGAAPRRRRRKRQAVDHGPQLAWVGRGSRLGVLVRGPRR